MEAVRRRLEKRRALQSVPVVRAFRKGLIEWQDLELRHPKVKNALRVWAATAPGVPTASCGSVGTEEAPT
jgi:hypothetical protein